MENTECVSHVDAITENVAIFGVDSQPLLFDSETTGMVFYQRIDSITCLNNLDSQLTLRFHFDRQLSAIAR